MNDVGAVILAGGEGSRLGPLGKLTPKCLLPLNDGASLLLRLLGQLAAAGVRNVVIAANASNHRQILEHVEALAIRSELRDLSVKPIVCENTPLGPLPALGEAALSLPTQSILMCLGDIFFFRSPFAMLLSRVRAGQEFDGYVVVGRDEVSRDDRGTGWIACTGSRVAAISYPPFPAVPGGAEILRWSGAFAFPAGLAAGLRNETERFSRAPLEDWVQSHVQRGSKLGWLDAGGFANVNSIREYELLLSRMSGDDPTYQRKRSAAGAGWIDRFLLPRMIERFGPDRRLDCQQFGDDVAERDRLRELGHRCEIIALDTFVKIPISRESFDLVFTGRFPVLARREEDRIELARNLFRILRPGGSLLLVFGNRRCPVDLSRNGPFLHGPRATSCLSASEAEEIFTKAAGFSEIRLLSVHGHHGWDRLPRCLRPLGHLADAYWRFLVTPTRRWLYTSFFNPTLILWINKD